MFNIFFFFENRAVYDIMWKNTVEPDKPQMTIWRMRIAFRIPKSTNTHLECVIVIAFPLQQWLHERASVLYVPCRSCYNVDVVFSLRDTNLVFSKTLRMIL